MGYWLEKLFALTIGERDLGKVRSIRQPVKFCPLGTFVPELEMQSLPNIKYKYLRFLLTVLQLLQFYKHVFLVIHFHF